MTLTDLLTLRWLRRSDKPRGGGEAVSKPADAETPSRPAAPLKFFRPDAVTGRIGWDVYQRSRTRSRYSNRTRGRGWVDPLGRWHSHWDCRCWELMRY